MDQIKLDEYYTRTKLLLGLTDDGNKELINFCIEDAENTILNYCRLSFIPRPLESLVSLIAADMYRVNGYGSEKLPQDITSISQGERSVAYATHRADDVMERYYSRLKPYRRARVPSEVVNE